MLPDVSDLVGDVSDVPMKDFEKIINQQVDKKALKGMSPQKQQKYKDTLKKAFTKKMNQMKTAMGLKAEEDDPDEEIAKLEEPDEERDIKFKSPDGADPRVSKAEKNWAYDKDSLTSQSSTYGRNTSDLAVNVVDTNDLGLNEGGEKMIT